MYSTITSNSKINMNFFRMEWSRRACGMILTFESKLCSFPKLQFFQILTHFEEGDTDWCFSNMQYTTLDFCESQANIFEGCAVFLESQP